MAEYYLLKPDEPQNKIISFQRPAESCVTSLAGIQALDHPESNWNRAAMDSSQVDPFCCRTEWQLSYHEAIEPYRELVVREVPGSLVAFAKLRNPDTGSIFVPVESEWFFGCPLLGPNALELLEEMLAEHEHQLGAPAHFVAISGLDPRGKLIQNIVKKLGPHFDFRLTHSNVLCNASLEGGLDGFLSRRSAKHRRGLGKQARRATKEGVTFERHVPTEAAEATRVYARMLAVEEESWKGIDECGMSVGESRIYYDCMLRRLSVSASGRVIFARHGERDIGYIFGGLAGRIYRGQQFSYAEDWKSFSIGNLLQLEQIEWLCEQNVVRYDMGPMMDYKKHWTELRRPIETLVLERKRRGSGAQFELSF